MGILIRKPLLPMVLSTIAGLTGCNMNTSPVTTNGSTLSFAVTAAVSAINPPQELQITIANEFGFFRERNVPNPGNNGSIQFPDVPFSHLFVDIQGFNNGIKTLFGHSEAEIAGPNANVNVVLRNALTTKTLTNTQELLFRQIATQRSVFWDNAPASATALCSTASGNATLRTTLLSSRQYLYFLFEITDNFFFTEDRADNQIGEMTADAVIVYLCKSPPHNLNPGTGVFPAVRLQCEVGKSLDEICRFNFINFSNDQTRNFTISALDNDEVNGRMLRRIADDPARRILELRINKELLGLPVIAIDTDQLFGTVIRYRNSYDAAQPSELSDWQSGQAETDPKTKLASWGYLDITP
ncbi:MAG: hypothetical protein JW863_12760 [Chitinispirillaceae bacterium]|nr:hypothetical protein [Chitinispirillaceae bacterium]